LFRRAQKNAAAQKRLAAIDEQLTILDREIADDETALAELRAQLTVAQNSIELAEWEGRRAVVRKMLVNRLSGAAAARLEKAAIALEKVFGELTEEDKQIGEALTAFEPKFRSMERSIRVLSQYRGRLVGYYLRQVIPSEGIGHFMSLYEGRDFAGVDQGEYGRALEDLDNLELVF
jgi:chromosome segregation ATPase